MTEQEARVSDIAVTYNTEAKKERKFGEDQIRLKCKKGYITLRKGAKYMISSPNSPYWTMQNDVLSSIGRMERLSTYTGILEQCNGKNCLYFRFVEPLLDNEILVAEQIRLIEAGNVVIKKLA